MNSDRTILDQLEACRPGSDDLLREEFGDLAAALKTDSNLADLYEQTQQSDALLKEAFHNVEAPAGLEERLLAGLGLAEDATGQPLQAVAAAVNEASEEGGDAEGLQAANLQRGSASLASMWTGVVAAALVLIAIAAVGWVLWEPAEPLSVASVEAQAASLHGQLDESAWDDNLTAAQQRRPFSPYVLTQPQAWQSAAGLGDSQGVAYRIEYLTDRNKAVYRATLYAFAADQDASALPLQPGKPITGSQGDSFAAGVWRNDDASVVYLFVVDGPDANKRFHQHVNVSTVVALNLSPAMLYQMLALR